MTANSDFIEQKIIEAIQELLAGKVNELLKKSQFPIPMIEISKFGYASSIVPEIALTICEQTEKERIIRIDAFSLTITFNIPETPESELLCYAYAGVVGRAVHDNPTLGGIVNRAVITGKKYNPPKRPHCGEDWTLVLTLRVTVEGMNK